MKKHLILFALLVFVISANAQTTAADTRKEHKEIFTAVEVDPEFPGGEQAFAKFLQANIIYPDVDKRKNVQGKVYLQFAVDRDGSVTDIKIISSPSKTLSAEAIRVMKLSPKWRPGTQNNKLVKVQYTTPITFSL